jgi:hypothetical protein
MPRAARGPRPRLRADLRERGGRFGVHHVQQQQLLVSVAGGTSMAGPRPRPQNVSDVLTICKHPFLKADAPASALLFSAAPHQIVDLQGACKFGGVLVLGWRWGWRHSRWAAHGLLSPQIQMWRHGVGKASRNSASRNILQQISGHASTSQLLPRFTHGLSRCARPPDAPARTNPSVSQ